MCVHDASARFARLLEARSYAEIARQLLSLETALGQVTPDDLRDDPFGTLEAHPELEVVHEVQTASSCSVAGYFRETSVPPALVIHPSGAYRRDAFTLLHEYGHYTQMAHSEWADVLLMRPGSRESVSVGERVADEFASEVLLPAATWTIDPSEVTARQLRHAFEQNPSVSRSALAYRTVSEAGVSLRLMVAVVADWGREVLFAKAVGDLMAPGRGVDQPSLRTLAVRARDSTAGVAYGDPTAEIFARSGRAQSDIQLEVATDHEGYAFVVGRPARRFGDTSWHKKTGECGNAACGVTFEIDPTVVYCYKCDDWRCPECRDCSCAACTTGICPRCHMQYTAAERSSPSVHECW